MWRPCADREEKRVTHGRDTRNKVAACRRRPPSERASGRVRPGGCHPLQCVTVTENEAMPRGCKPTGEHALSNAERQASYRARHQAEAITAVTRPRRPVDRRSRPQRWRDAVSTLLTPQAEYADWLQPLPITSNTAPRPTRSTPLSIST